MAITYKQSNTKIELLEIASVNGIQIEDGMTKVQIIAALNTHGAQESAMSPALPDTEAPAEEAQDSTDKAKATTEVTSTHDMESPTKEAQDSTEDTSEYRMFVYAGPSLPNGRLKENAVFRGTIEDVKKHLADVLEDFPQIEKLIVPVHRLAAFSAKVKAPGNAVHKYFNDIVSTMHGHKEV